jgi:hypothetical protein
MRSYEAVGRRPGVHDGISRLIHVCVLQRTDGAWVERYDAALHQENDMLYTVTSSWRRLADKLQQVTDSETLLRKQPDPLAKKNEQLLETWEGEGGKTVTRPSE